MIGVSISPATAPLSALLREATADLHTEAERSGFIADLLHRRGDRHGYLLLIRNLVPIYRTLEAALSRQPTRPLLRLFCGSELARAQALATDVRMLGGATWEQDIPVLPEGEAYAARIAELGEQGSMALGAHAYVRYFGDLSGGQVVKKLLADTMQLPPAALSHYAFAQISDLTAYKQTMRAAFDREALSEADRAVLVDEARRAFSHNIALSRAIKARLAAPADGLV